MISFASRLRSAFMSAMLVLAAVGSAGVVTASDGSIDPDFGVLGMDLVPASIEVSGEERTFKMSDGPETRIITASGRQLVAGRADSSQDRDAAVLAISADGGLDTSFSDDGIFVDALGFTTSYVFGIHEVDVGGTTRYLLTGARDSFSGGVGGYPFVALLDTNGDLVSSWGTGGVATHSTWNYSRSFGIKAAYVAGGYAYLLIFGDTASGDSFSSYDVISFNLSTGAEHFLNGSNVPMALRAVDIGEGVDPRGLWVDSARSNIFVVRAERGATNDSDVVVKKFAVPATGYQTTVDSSFGTSGVLTIGGMTTYYGGSELYSFTDGANVMIVTGTGYPAGSLQATRFTPDGAQVTSGFGTAGMVTVDAVSTGYEPRMRPTADGGYLVSFSDSSVHLLDSAGAPVTTFGDQGVIDNTGYTKCRRQFQAIGSDSNGDLYFGGTGTDGVYGETLSPGAEQTQVIATIKLTSDSGVDFADCYNPQTVYPTVEWVDQPAYEISPGDELPAYQISNADAWEVLPTCTDDWDTDGEYGADDVVTISCAGGSVGSAYALGSAGPWTRVVAIVGGSSGSSDPGPSDPGPYTPPRTVEPESVTAVLGADGVTVTISGVPAGVEYAAVRVSPTSWEVPDGPSDEPYYAWFNAAPPDAVWLDEADGVAEVVDGVITLVIPNLTLDDDSACDYDDLDSYPDCIVSTTEEFSAGTAYRISYSLDGEDSDGRWRVNSFDLETEMQNYVAVTTGGASDDTASDETASDESSSGVVAPGEGVVSSQVTESNASTFVRNPGEVSLVDSDGNPVIGELVRVSDSVGSVPAGSRTAEQVAQIRSEAQAMVAALEERLPEGVSSPVSVVETESGANISGLVTDPADDTSDLPVPVEDVVLLVTEEQALLIGGADGPADPADVRNGVLEIGPNGEVSALAYGLTPGASGELVVMSSPTLLGTFTVGADGSFQGQAALPSTLAAGSHTVVLAADGLVASAGVVVTGGVTLPVTGGESSSVPWAVLVVAAGALAVLVIRRRVVV